METLTQLVSESLARHGFDRPVDYRRLSGHAGSVASPITASWLSPVNREYSP